jgi:hypothetical protein
MEKHMPQVKECEANECLYNSEGKCHTFGITVGSEEPCCDTFMAGSSKGGIADIMAGVGACHVSACSFNDNHECSASNIKVVMKSGHPDCGTFKSL